MVELTPLQKLLAKQRAAHLDKLAGNRKAARAAAAPARDNEETLLQKLEKAARLRQLDKHSEESIDWFKANARKSIGRERAQDSLLTQQKPAKAIGAKSPIGKMFTYAYDAKWKDTLPYYDRFPLIFYVGPAKNGFYGINLHYLSPDYRAVLFDALLDIVETNKIPARNKLKVTYDILKSSTKLNYFKPCFKHYLKTQVESQIVEIPYNEWEAAMFLPTANFGKVSATQVWSDSALKLGA